MLLAILGFYLWPSQWGGDTTYVVVKGTSMQPDYRTGDIVIARSSDDHDVGDVLVYAVPERYNGAGTLIMHRLKSIEANGRYIIQGDNRDSPDDFEIRSDDVVGVAQWHIPRVGALAQVLGHWWFIAALVAAFALLRLWPDDDEPDDEDIDEARAVALATSRADGELARPDDPQRRRRSDRRSAERRGTAPGTEPQIESLIEPQVESLIEPRVEPQIDRRPRPMPTRAARAQVFVDGDGLAGAGWTEVHLDASRQRATDAADDIGRRFGTPVALVFDREATGLDDRPHAYVEIVPDDGSVASLLLGHVAGRRVGLAALVVTDDVDLANKVRASGGAVMCCSAWLELGERVGAAVH